MAASLVVLLALFAPGLAQEARAPLEGSLRGGRARPRSLQENPQTTAAPEDSTPVVPDCSPGYIDVTDGNAYRWTCAFYCEGGPNFATAGCLCACLTEEQIVKLGVNLSTTTEALARSDEVIVTPKPNTDGTWSAPVEETPVGELHDGPIGPLAVPEQEGGYVADVSSSTTPAPMAPTEEPAYTDWQTILLILSGTFLIIVAMAMVLVFAHRNGFLGAIQVAKTNKLGAHTDDAHNQHGDSRLSPDKLAALRRASQLHLADADMSPDAMIAMEHLEKLRQSGNADSKKAAENYLGTLVNHVPSGTSAGSQDDELPMARRKSAPDLVQEPELPPMQRRFSAPAADQLQVPGRTGTNLLLRPADPNVVLLAGSEQLQALRTPSKISNSSGRSLTHREQQASRRHSEASEAPIATMAKDRLAATWRSSKDSTRASQGSSPSHRQSSRHSQHSASSAKSPQPEALLSPSRHGSKVSKAPSSPSRRGSKVSQVLPTDLLT